MQLFEIEQFYKNRKLIIVSIIKGSEVDEIKIRKTSFELFLQDTGRLAQELIVSSVDRISKEIDVLTLDEYYLTARVNADLYTFIVKYHADKIFLNALCEFEIE
jgi:hypothetical protein